MNKVVRGGKVAGGVMKPKMSLSDASIWKQLQHLIWECINILVQNITILIPLVLTSIVAIVIIMLPPLWILFAWVRKNSYNNNRDRPKVKSVQPSGRILYDAQSVLQTTRAKKHLQSLSNIFKK